MLSSEKVAELLLEIGAVTVNTRAPFRYASGLVGPIYTDCRLLASRPTERNAVIEAMLEQVNSFGVKVDIVVGAGTPGVWLAADLSKRLGVPMAYTRTTSKDHGTRRKIEGRDIFGLNNSLLVADIVSTEKDIPEAIQTIESAGAKPICCIAILTNNIGAIEATLQEHSIPLVTLTDMQTLLTVALLRGNISPEDKTRVEEWLHDPAKWQSPAKDQIVETLSASKDEVADILLRIGAVAFNTDTPYRFSSGLLSPIYLDARRLISFPSEWEHVLSFFEKSIVDYIKMGNINMIAGITMGGIPHATQLASRFNIPMAYVKSSADEHGKRSRIEGYIKAGDHVIVVDDVVTTGSSIISAVTVLRDASATVSHCLAIFTYEMDDAVRAVERAGLSLVTLTNLTSLVEMALKRQLISQAEVSTITAWCKNPWGWMKDLTGKSA